MWFKNFILKNKKNLTEDVFELVFESSDMIDAKAWQFITFILEKIGWRAYSILDIDKNNIVLIIKRLENWRWGSKFICDLDIGEKLVWVWPSWHFTLRENKKNKLFLWTWTWFVPLYNMAINWLKKDKETNYKIIFWTRLSKDLFYIKELKKLKEKHKNFDFEIYLSRENNLNDSDYIKKGYTTDFLSPENIAEFGEFYICWVWEMIDSTKDILNKAWIEKENIFTEKY